MESNTCSIQGRGSWLVRIKVSSNWKQSFKMGPLGTLDTGGRPKCAKLNLFMECLSCARCNGTCQLEGWAGHSSYMRRAMRPCSKSHGKGPLTREESPDWARPCHSWDGASGVQLGSEWRCEEALCAKASAWASHGLFLLSYNFLSHWHLVEIILVTKKVTLM